MSSSSLQIKYNSIWGRSGKILDPTTGQAVYSLEHHFTSPHIVFESIPNDTQVAAATSRCWEIGVTFNVHGHEFKVKPRNIVSSSYVYDSPALGQRKVQWVQKSGWTRFSYVAMGEDSLPIARFTTEKSLTNWKSLGRTEFADGGQMSEKLKLEMMVVGTTLAYNLLVKRNTAAA